jgi:hypothetical protein
MRAAKAARIPDGVIEAVNELLSKEFDGKRALLKQNKVLVAISEKMNVPRDTVFANKWLDFEDVYRQAGWLVTYDKPAYNETYEATFEFRKK